MKKYVIIVASGSGKRMGECIPKQFLVLKNKPILLHTLENVYNSSSEYNIILVLNKEHLSLWKDIIEKYDVNVPHKVVYGGRERFFSVKNAIESINENSECLVAIHDGVRPFVNKEILHNCFALTEQNGNAVCCTRCVDSVRVISNNNNSTFNRDNIRLIQTPQCFYLTTLKKAYCQEYSEIFTDDASVVEKIGEKIFLCNGDRKNIKITTPEDLKIAESLLR